MEERYASGFNLGSSNAQFGSREFSEQIAHLEQEGKKIIDATLTLGETMAARGDTKPYTGEEPKKSLAHLTDISAEQNAISHLSAQLDAGSREASRLQNRLYGDTRAGILQSLDIPQYAAASPTYDKPVQPTYAPDSSSYRQSILEREVSAARSEMNEYRCRMDELCRVNEQQKEQFRSAVADLKGQLQDALITKENVVQMRERELSDHEAVVNKLKGMYSQQEQANRIQEETLLEVNERLESTQKDSYMNDGVISQLRGLLRDQENIRGRVFYETEPINTQSTSMLLHTIERCLNELHAEILTSKERAAQFHGELEVEKSGFEERYQLMLKEYQERGELIRLEHEEELRLSHEQMTTAQEQASVYQQQIIQLKSELEVECRQRLEKESQLEHQILEKRSQYEQELAQWTVKRESLESALDETEQEVAVVQNKWDESLKKTTQVKGQTENLQKSINRLTTELELEREQRQKWECDYDSLMQQCQQLHEQLRAKEQTILEASQSYKSLELQCQAEIEHTMESMQRKQDEHTSVKMSGLTEQLASMTRQYEQVTDDLGMLKVKHGDLHAQHQELNVECKELCEKELENKTHLGVMNQELTDKQSRLERQQKALSEVQVKLEQSEREKSYQQRIIDQQTNQITGIKSDLDKVNTRADDYQHRLEMITEQHRGAQIDAESAQASNALLKDERDTLSSKLSTTITELEHLKTASEETSDKLKNSEAHITAVEEDNVQLADAVSQLRIQLDERQRDQQQLEQLLEETRVHADGAKEECDQIKHHAQQREEEYAADVKKISHRLKHAEQERKLARKALKVQENVDGKAIRVAGKMQKEVTEKRGTIDSLQTRINWLEECLEIALKEKKQLEEEIEIYRSGVHKPDPNYQNATQEISKLNNTNQQLNNKISAMQTALDKAALSNAEYQAKLEKLQQDLARQQLKHQLQIKELSRVSLSAIDAPYRGSFTNLLDSDQYRESANSVPNMFHQRPVTPNVLHHGSNVPHTGLTLATSQEVSQDRPASTEAPLKPLFTPLIDRHAPLTLHPQYGGRMLGSDGEKGSYGGGVVESGGDRGSYGAAHMMDTHSSSVDLPVSQKPTQRHREQLATENTVGTELRTLLDEMKDLVFFQKQATNTDSTSTVDYQHQSSISDLQPSLPRSIDTHPSTPPTRLQEYHTPGGVTERSQGQTTQGHVAHEYYSPTKDERFTEALPSGSNHQRLYGHQDHVSLSKPSGLHSDVRPFTASEIQQLIEQTHQASIPPHRMQTESTQQPDQDRAYSPQSSPQRADEHLGQHTGPYENRVLLTKDTQALCQRLENKIQNLTKMGSQLQQDNQEVAKMMQTQDRKLKQVRSAERSIATVMT